MDSKSFGIKFCGIKICGIMFFGIFFFWDQSLLDSNSVVSKSTLGKLSKKKSRENNENGILGRGVSDLIHFFKTLHKSEKGGVERQSLYFIKYQTRPFFTWISLLFGCIFVYMTDFYLN